MDSSSNVNKSNDTMGEEIPFMYDIGMEDGTWVLTASMIIFTMQTGKNIILSMDFEHI